MKHIVEKYKNKGTRAQVAVGLVCAVVVLALLAHFVSLARATFHPLMQVNGTRVAPPAAVLDDSGKAMSEADPVAPRGGIQSAAQAIIRVPVAHAETGVGLFVPILMYHHVGPLPPESDGVRKDLTVSPQDFVAQVAWLARNGYTSVSLQDVYLATQHTFTLPRKPIVFTFDDGYADVFAHAVPVLQQYGMVGSFAVVPGFFGTPDYATWANIISAKSLAMEIVSHFDCSSPKFDSAYIEYNLRESLTDLESHIGPVPRILVYPYGHFTPEYVAVAERVGFTMALTTHFGTRVNPADLMHTPRVRVHGSEPLDKFIEILTGKKK